MNNFQGVAEKFSVYLLSDEGHGSERIRCEVGLNGLVLSSPDGYRTIRSYPLNHISRWAMRGSNLVLYTKSPSDVEELTLTLQGEERTITSILDTLTCCCMQMVELLQSKGGSSSNNTEVTNSLTQLLNGDSKSKKSQLTQVEDVEFWRNPEKQGWMHSQGEVIKSWRRRWFVLKQGFLFRFSSPDVSATTKARGVVDLSKVTDVSEAREQTSKNNSFKLSTETGHIAYVCDSETELVEWISALEGAVSTIVKKIAGVEDAPIPPKKSVPKDDWSKQLERVYSSAGGGGGGGSRGSGGGGGGNPMVKVVGYDPPARPSSHGSHQGSRDGYGREEYGRRGSQPDYGGYGDSLSPSNITGIAGIARDSAPMNPSSTFSDSFSRSEYPAYPVLTPSGSSSYGQGQPGPGGYASVGSSGGGGGYGQGASGGYQQNHGQQDQGQGGYGQGGQYGGEPSYHAQPQPPQMQPAGSWQVHYTGEGRAYYHNAQTNTTQWDPPAGM